MTLKTFNSIHNVDEKLYSEIIHLIDYVNNYYNYDGYTINVTINNHVHIFYENCNFIYTIVFSDYLNEKGEKNAVNMCKKGDEKIKDFFIENKFSELNLMDFSAIK